MGSGTTCGWPGRGRISLLVNRPRMASGRPRPGVKSPAIWAAVGRLTRTFVLISAESETGIDGLTPMDATCVFSVLSLRAYTAPRRPNALPHTDTRGNATGRNRSPLLVHCARKAALGARLPAQETPHPILRTGMRAYPWRRAAKITSTQEA